MLVLHSICFVYIPLHFYAFFGTNLLTRCHSVSSMFSAVFYFRKVVQEIFSKLDEIKPKFLFYRNEDGDRRGDEEAPRGGHTWPRRSPAPGHA